MKKNGTEIMSFSLPKELVQKLDSLSKTIGYSTRSELIRDGVRLLIKEHEKVEAIAGRVEGVIILLYDHAAEVRVSEMRHHYTDIVRSYTHTDFQEKSHRCCEILVFGGEAAGARELIHGLQSLRNVDEVRVFLA
jgi:CopG family nickel-responsive transcriptional regulator